MKTLDELTSAKDPAIRLVREWASTARVACELLPPSSTRAETLVAVQVSTRSVLGAVAFETGGILVEHGWLRILGSGHERLPRSLLKWNVGRADGFYLVADDATGGFFALNGGHMGPDHGKLYYFAPDSLQWEAMDIEYSQFVMWSMSERIQKFYESARWASWKEDVARLHGDRCYFFYPPLWTKEGSPEKSHRGEVPVAESWGAQMDFAAQLEGEENA
jgi:hypothetical protein